MQIQHDAVISRFGGEKALQLLHLFPVDATTQGKDDHVARPPPAESSTSSVLPCITAFVALRNT